MIKRFYFILVSFCCWGFMYVRLGDEYFVFKVEI